MMDIRRPLPGLLLLAAAILLTAFAYWPGLSGPLLLDDFNNLADVRGYLEGERSWAYVVFQNRSGPGGRPIAMASFLLDAMVWGYSVWHFKLTNLLLHLGCGVLVFTLLCRILRRDVQLAPAAQWVALLIAVCWVALPINVSTVLYVVQRMAQLSTFFLLLGVLLYVVAREAIDGGKPWGAPVLWLAVPLIGVLAFFSKENGVLLPFLVAGVELAWFQPKSGSQRPRTVRLWFALAVAVPIAVALLLAAIHPERLLASYQQRDFTLWERLLTQPRVLWDYVAAILVPYGPRLGLFHDNFPVSRALLSPWTTPLALFGWIAVVVFAWFGRNRDPAILGGVLLFLSGHALESSVLPLEIYFEHRNYLPSVGLLIAVAGIVAAGRRWLPRPTRLFRMASVAILIAVPMTLLWATHARAIVWSSTTTLYAQDLTHNPTSPRLRSFLAGAAISKGRLDEALDHIAVAEAHAPARERMTHTIWRLLAHCTSDRPPDQSLYDELQSRTASPITRFGMTAWELLATRIEAGECSQVDAGYMVTAATAWLANSSLPDASQPIWRTRYYTARLLANNGHLEAAAALGEAAWEESAHNNGIGVFVFQVNASLGRWDKCAQVAEVLNLNSGQGDYRLDEAAEKFRAAVEQHRRRQDLGAR